MDKHLGILGMYSYIPTESNCDSEGLCISNMA